MRLVAVAVVAAVACTAAGAAEAQIQHWDVGRGVVLDDLLENGGRAKVHFVAGVTGEGAAAATDVGCIEVITATGSDRGCGSVPGGGSVDDTLNTGTLRFTVPSEVHDGGTLTVNVTLAGFGSYSTDRPLAVDPGSPVRVDAAARVVRLAVPSGGVVSSTVGGGLLQASRDGTLFQGASVTLTVSE